MQVAHYTAGAAVFSKLVLDARDVIALRTRLADALGESILAYCVMTTHAHLVLEGEQENNRATMRQALRRYKRDFNRRHKPAELRFRGPIVVIPCPGGVELGRTIAYLHQNPVGPIVTHDAAFEWSSAPEYAGISLLPLANRKRAEELAARSPFALVGWKPALADLEPVTTPTVRAEVLLAASARTFGLLPEDLVADTRTRGAVAARSAFVAVGKLESYRLQQLSDVLGRTRQRASQIADRAEQDGVRIARTIARSPIIRPRLERALASMRATAT